MKPFVLEGLSQIEKVWTILISKPSSNVRSVVMVSKSIYIGLLKSAFRGKPLFTGRKDGTNRHIRFDRDSMLFYDATDDRMIVHDNLKHTSSAAPSTVFGAEILARKKRGDDSNIFEYDKTGKYIGARVNGKIVSPEDLSKPPSNNFCGKCGKETKQKCGKCKIVFYCSKECQTSEWPSHKKFCQIAKLDEKGSPVLIL